MSSTRVTRIDGAPGAGKTHELRERLLEEHETNGFAIDRFWWLNFSNAGREDVEPEIAEVYAHRPKRGDDDMRPEDRAKTFHGLALYLAMREGLIINTPSESQLIVQGKRDSDGVDRHADFCRRQGMGYDRDHSDPRKLLAGGSDSSDSNNGNLLFAINDYLTQTCKSLDQWRDSGINISIDGDRVEELLQRWDAYKRNPPGRDHRLFEHGDYIDMAFEWGLIPDADVLFIDEFQDLAPVEYRLFKMWRDDGDLRRVYIAGDPNQAIYSFRGGSPYYFEETDVDETIDLKVSWRCKQDIAAIGSSVLSAHPDTDPRGFAGKVSGGSVRWREIRDRYTLHHELIDTSETYRADPSALLLTRTNYQLYQLTRDLRDVGIPFEVLGTTGGVWQGELRGMLIFLNNLEHGDDKFLSRNMSYIFNALPDGDARRKRIAVPAVGVLERDRVERHFEEFGSAWDLVNHLQIDAWKRDVLRNALKAPPEMGVGEIRVGTIHTAKGLEAPAVYLFTESSDTMVQRYNRDVETAVEEHRVYYVGASRASSELHLVDGYFDGPTAPPIDKIRRRMGVIT